MEDFYATLRTIPEAMIAAGIYKPVTITRRSGVPDAETLKRSTTTETLSGFGKMGKTRTQNAAGELILNSYIKMTIEPMIGDKITFGDSIYECKMIEARKPDGHGITWKAFVK